MRDTLKIGTRGSALALTQARWVAEKLKKQMPDVTVDIVVIKTKGDIMQDVSLAKIGGKGLFVKEIEDALLRNEIDIAVHSMKDVPVELPGGLEIGVTSEREDPRDVLISKDKTKIEDMPQGARIGTGSLRRGFQLRNLFPGIELIPLRGNLDTRIRKIQSESLDGIIVAAAGMRRMGWTDRITQYIPVDIMLPSVGQGALGIELRKNDSDTRNAVSFINHPQTWIEVSAERAFLKRLGGGCQLPIAGYGRKMECDIILSGLLGSLDGRVLIRDEVRGHCDNAEALGTLLADRILSKGGKAILDEVYKKGSFCGETR
ncbi:MAG: hydroxymethylbilane synthase [Deltaproteobacteria bacterium]|nr:hydroxymethylbilane synthase [Deltaproteobacteria bacterium]